MATAKKLPSGSWRCLVYDYTDDKGKRHYKSFTANSKKEAERLAANYAVEKESLEKKSSYEDMTLSEAIDRYIESNNALLSPSSIAGYRKIKRNAFPGIINKKLSKLTNEDLRNAVNEECQRPKSKKGNGTIKPKTVKSEWELVRAVIKRYSPNTDTSVLLPKIVSAKHDLSTPETIYNMVKDSDIELPVMLAMWLSFTASEIIGLTKSKSISADGNEITITQVIVMDENRKQVTKEQAKQPMRNRTLVIPDYIKGLIDKVDGDKLVDMTGEQLSKKFSRMVKKAGIPHMTFHDLRHVNASVMTLLHVPNKYAQERGGWHSDNIMKSVYQQTFAPERISVDERIDGYFSGVVSGKTVSPKYKHYLALFELEDCKDSLEQFEKFCSENGIKA